nr:hypothetical protein [Burkholderia paludis]
MSKDPIGLVGGINVYVCVKSPVIWIDHLGLQAMGPALLGMGNLYRSDLASPLPEIVRNSEVGDALGEVTNYPWPAPRNTGGVVRRKRSMDDAR